MPKAKKTKKISEQEIYDIMVSLVKEHVEETAGEDEYVAIEEENGDGITVYDITDYPFDRTYTIASPKVMTKKWLRDRIVVTPSAKNMGIDVNTVADWLHKNLEKRFYSTLQYIVFCGDDEEGDFDYLRDLNDFFYSALEEHDLPSDSQIGINWFSASCVIIHVGNIFIGTRKMIESGEIYDWEENLCNNQGVAETLVHEIRHLAQSNPYIPDEFFGSLDPNPEEDAEIFARRFYDRHPVQLVDDVDD